MYVTVLSAFPARLAVLLDDASDAPPAHRLAVMDMRFWEAPVLDEDYLHAQKSYA